MNRSDNWEKFPSQNPYPIMQIAADGCLLFSNQACEPILDTWKIKDQEGPLPKSLQMAIQECHARQSSQEVEIMLADQCFLFILIPVQKDGSTNLYGLDITERQKNRDELKLERETLQVTLQSIGDGVISSDTKGQIAFMNPVAEALTGYSIKTALGLMANDILKMLKYPSRQPLSIPINEMMGCEKRRVCITIPEALLQAKDGSERIVSINVSPILKDECTIGTVMVFRDITERQHFLEEMLKVTKLDSLEFLAGGIAHDFNNILTTILGSLYLAKKIEETDKRNHRLQIAEDALKQAQHLTQQLLSFAKNGTPVTHQENLADILHETIRFTITGSSAIKCDLSLANDLWLVTVDAGQISQVLNNLLINAIQAMSNGGTIRIIAENRKVGAEEMPFLSEGTYIHLAMTDQGHGIAKEHLAKIFDPYFTTKETGNGLGLASSYSIIRHHQGHMFVESEEGQGSTFHIYLPALPVQKFN